MTALRLAPLAALLTLAGCDTLGPGDTRYPGVLVLNDPDVETVAAPDTVVAGRPFTVAVTTTGGGCERQGDVETEVQGRLAVIQPFDVSRGGPGQACAAILAYFRHTATVVLAEPGTATLRAVGADRYAGDAAIVVNPVEVERTVVVVVPATF